MLEDSLLQLRATAGTLGEAKHHPARCPAHHTPQHRPPCSTQRSACSSATLFLPRPALLHFPFSSPSSSLPSPAIAHVARLVSVGACRRPRNLRPASDCPITQVPVPALFSTPADGDFDFPSKAPDNDGIPHRRCVLRIANMNVLLSPQPSLFPHQHESPRLSPPRSSTLHSSCLGFGVDPERPAAALERPL